MDQWKIDMRRRRISIVLCDLLFYCSKMKRIFLFLFSCNFLLAAGIVEWNPDFNLWMPAIAARVRPSVFSEENKKLPFDEPKIEFAPSPIFQKAPLDAWKALIYRQPYFASATASPVASASKQYLKIDGVENPIALEEMNVPESSFILSRTPTDCIILGTAELSPATSEAISRAAAQALPMPGEYKAKIISR